MYQLYSIYNPNNLYAHMRIWEHTLIFDEKSYLDLNF